ncbi:MAG TPA: putative HNHc nuclease [Candidatus Omnitrophota bacterium]|nr:putative HNHc nuclease [Candidatus Omnitrophota bacterium]
MNGYEIFPRITGKIEDFGNGRLVLSLTPDIEKYIRRKLEQQNSEIAELRIDDGRLISNEQRRKIYATVRDISKWSGDDPERIKELTKFNFCSKANIEPFSLSNTDMSVAHEFLSYLIDFCLEWRVPCAEPLWARSEDIYRYVYKCVEHRLCAITGRDGAQIHHVDRVGMRKRDQICHVGMRVMPLSPEWHDKVHHENEKEIYEEHHLEPITLDEYLVKRLHLGNITNVA